MAYSPVKNVRAEKTGSTNWSQMLWFSFQKVDLHLVHWNPGPNRPIFRDIRIQYILPVKNEAQRSTTTITKMAPPLMFSFIFLCKHKLLDEIEMASIVVEFCFYYSSIFTLNNYF